MLPIGLATSGCRTLLGGEAMSRSSESLTLSAELSVTRAAQAQHESGRVYTRVNRVSEIAGVAQFSDPRPRYVRRRRSRSPIAMPVFRRSTVAMAGRCLVDTPPALVPSRQSNPASGFVDGFDTRCHVVGLS